MSVYLSDPNISRRHPCDICVKLSRHWLGWQPTENSSFFICVVCASGKDRNIDPVLLREVEALEVEAKELRALVGHVDVSQLWAEAECIEAEEDAAGSAASERP
jgi:hypothetical protein